MGTVRASFVAYPTRVRGSFSRRRARRARTRPSNHQTSPIYLRQSPRQQLVAILGVAGAMQLIAWPLGLGRYALGILAAQWLAFVPSYLARTETFYDLTGERAPSVHCQKQA